MATQLCCSSCNSCNMVLPLCVTRVVMVIATVDHSRISLLYLHFFRKAV